MGLFDRFRFSGKPRTEIHEPIAETPRDEAMRLIDEGNLIEEAGQLDEALRCYDAAIATDPNLARAHMNRGNVLLARGNAEEALHAYQKALELEPDYAAAHYNAGNAQANLNNHEAACAAYEQAILLKPDFTDAHVALGCTLDDLGRRDEAAASYRKALEICPDYAEVHANLGKTLLALGQQEEGMASLQRATDLMPDDMETLFVLGSTQKSRGQLEVARSSLSRVQAASPENIDVNIHLGDTLLELVRQTKPSPAIAGCLTSPQITSSPTTTWEMFTLTLGLFDVAVTCYRQALELQPDSAAIHSNLGAILKDIGEPIEGIKSIRRALEIAPEFTDGSQQSLFIGHSLNDFSQAMLLEEARDFWRNRRSQSHSSNQLE